MNTSADALLLARVGASIIGFAGAIIVSSFAVGIFTGRWSIDVMPVVVIAIGAGVRQGKRGAVTLAIVAMLVYALAAIIAIALLFLA